jgi:hypothetical protein
MIGRNTLIVNTATVMQAMQEWLDKRSVGLDVQVTNVAVEDKSHGTFAVSLLEKEKEE